MEAVKQKHIAGEFFPNADCDIDLSTFRKIEDLLTRFSYAELLEAGLDEKEYLELKKAFEHYKVMFLS